MITTRNGFIEAVAAVKAAMPERLRPLKWNELVRRGDFVAAGGQGFEPWEGPSGFRADAFVKQIFRRDESRARAAKKSK